MDYAGLKTAIADWSARTDLTSYLTDMIDFATAGFNHGIPERGIAPLRTREMMTVSSLTPASGAIALPSDYLQYIRVVEKASIRRELKYVVPTYTDQVYPDRVSGLASDFTIIGSSLYMFPVSTTDHELTYYAEIPDLSVSNTSNWLLAKHPMLYLHASLLQVGIFTKDNVLMARSSALVTSMIDGINLTNELAIYARAGTRLQGLNP